MDRIMTNLKTTWLGLALFITLIACDGPAQKNRQISVTIEPQRYFAEKIVGDRFQISTVVPNGQSPESYDPSPKQMIEIGQSIAYFQIGNIGFEQAWMDNIKKNNPETKFYDLSKGVKLIQLNEEDTEEADHHEEDGHEHHHHHHGTDPHIWSSIEGAKIISQNILDAVIELDPDNKGFYEANYQKLSQEIEQTGNTIRQLLANKQGSAFIIYHPALTYFANENGLTQLCIEMDGKEPSPAQLKALVETAKKHQAQVIFIQQEFDQKNAEMISQETGCALKVINPLDYQWDKELINIAKALAHGETH